MHWQQEVPVEKIHVVTGSIEGNSCAALLGTYKTFSPLIPSCAKRTMFLSGAYETFSPKIASLLYFVCPSLAPGKALSFLTLHKHKPEWLEQQRQKETKEKSLT